MPNRREFLQSGAAVSAVGVSALLPPDARALGTAARPAVALQAAIVDDRYAAAASFGVVLGARGVPVHTLDDGDITRVWCEQLPPLWRRRRVAVAGLTQFGPMLVVEQLAAERGLRTILRVEHRIEQTGALAHVAAAPDSVLGWLEDAAASGLEWPTLMALAACRCEAGHRPTRTATLRLPGGTPVLSAEAAARARIALAPVHYYSPSAVQQGYGVAADGPLYSWLVAPHPRGEG
jgi:hypothetical protein